MYLKTATKRWNKILQYADHKSLRRAINWAGTFDTIPNQNVTPSDREFCDHYEKLLKSHESIQNFVPENNIYILVLDNDITVDEVNEQIKRLKMNKAAGCDGLAPGILKLLNVTWIMLLTFLFNVVFNGHYPHEWNKQKVFNIFKKGDRSDTNNYRGISVMGAISKLYDMVLASRFAQWYKPLQEQAGGQKYRGCEEQILVIRLLIEIARKTKRKLYIAFIDYQKAYDRLNRSTLLKMLDQKGCGTKFLKALRDSMVQSVGVIGNEQFEATSGVKQGGCTSCSIFTFYIDETVRAVKQYGQDGWLNDLHLLLFMDDTVVFATSKIALQQKLVALKQCADKLGMIIHPTKTKYISVNSDEAAPVDVDDIRVEKTDQYVYLGSPIFSGSIADQVQAHINMKAPQTLKFLSFLTKNSDAPFQVKEKVWNSAMLSAVLYSSETWFTSNLRSVERPYMATLKQLLKVRQSTCNDLVLVELGRGDAKSLIMDKQKCFLHKLTQREDYKNSHIERTISQAIALKTQMGSQIQDRINYLNSSYVEEKLYRLKDRIQSSESTRRKVYYQMNPSLSKCVL